MAGINGVTETVYTIKKGDTLSKIAKEHNTTVSELKEMNNIQNPNLIFADTDIKVPVFESFEKEGEKIEEKEEIQNFQEYQIGEKVETEAEKIRRIKSKVKISIATVDEPKNNKLTFNDVTKNLKAGFVQQGKDLVKGIKENPLMAVGAAVGTGVAIAALPLIGVTSAAGGAMLAAGYAAYAGVKAIKNTMKAIEHNKNGEYEKAQQDLKEVGASGFDLALSLPFLPKGVKHIKQFVKYGKVKVNPEFVSQVKAARGFSGKAKALKSANKELTRSWNYQGRVDAEVASVGGTKSFQAQLKSDLLEYNVADDKIAEVTIKRLAREKGYKTTPTFVKEKMNKYTGGYYSGRDCKIAVKDYSLGDEPLKPGTAGGKCITSKKQNKTNPSQYICEVQDRTTGKVTYETIDKKVFELHQRVISNDLGLARQTKDISIITHEFEHFDQDCKVVRATGSTFGRTNTANQKFGQILREKGQIKAGTPEYNEAMKYKYGYEHYTSSDPIKYMENALEIGAREAEDKLHHQQWFKSLDYLYETAKPMKIVNRPFIRSAVQVVNSEVA